MDDGSRLPWIIAIILLFCAAWFAVAETAFASASRTKIKTALDRGDPRAEKAMYVLDNFDRAITTLLICTNIVHISAAAIVTVAVTARWGLNAVTVSTVLTTIVVFFAGEMLPKSVAKNNSERLALSCAGPLCFFMTVFRPAASLLTAIGRKAAERTSGDPEVSVTEDELYDIIEDMTEEGTLDTEQGDLISSALQFGDVTVESILTPRVDVTAVDASWDIGRILDVVRSTGHSRLPVYEGSIDNIIGVLYLNSFLKALTSGSVVDIKAQLMPVCYIYKTVKLPEVLNTLRRARQHLAVVTDEYGGTLGVVSMEDVLEQIVGDIWDESDVVEEEIVEKNEGEYELDGDMMLSDFEELFSLDDEGFEAESETVGGWTVEMFSRYPAPGESFTYDRLTVTVLEADHRRVEKVRVVAAPEPEKEKNRIIKRASV